MLRRFDALRETIREKSKPVKDAREFEFVQAGQ